MITKVAILSGEEPLMNLEVRVGNNNRQDIPDSERYTKNARCGVYYGPTLVRQQWVEVDCGVPRGLKGKFLNIQLTERYKGDNPLEITELEIYGWGRVCSNRDPE